MTADLVAALGALADEWTQATCQTDGAPCSWHRVAAECAAELRQTIAAHQPAEPERCTGAGTCPAPLHVHGCYADLDGTACDEPDDHPPTQQSERTDTAEAGVPFLLGALQDAVNRAREDRAAQPSEPEREATCAGCGQPLRCNSTGLNTCDSPDCPGNLAWTERGAR